MLDLLSKAWQESKVKVLLVAIPLFVILLAAIFLKAWRSWLLASAEKLIKKTMGRDKELSSHADAANAEAEEHKAKADELKKKAKAIDGDDDEDWNKKV